MQILSIPADKSISHRALIIASLRSHATKIINLSKCDDVCVTLKALRDVGVSYKVVDNTILVHPIDKEAFKYGDVKTINCRGSGTSARILLGYAAGLNLNLLLYGDSSLSKRPMQDTIEPLKQLGAKFDCYNVNPFYEKSPVDKPILFISLGGVGSGKTSLERYAKKITDGNYVSFSIDQARNYDNKITQYIECNQHDDDYISLRWFASELLKSVMEYALVNKYNFYYDGSGIPFSNKALKAASNAKKLGYKVVVLAASAPLFVPKERRYKIEPVHLRIIKRLRKKGRMVPWSIVLDKHISEANAILDAAGSEYVDEFMLYDSSKKKGETELVGYTSAQCSMDNYSMQLKNGKFLVVTNINAMTDIIQKASLNSQACGYEELELNIHKFHVPEIDYWYDIGDNHKVGKLLFRKTEAL